MAELHNTGYKPFGEGDRGAKPALTHRKRNTMHDEMSIRLSHIVVVVWVTCRVLAHDDRVSHPLPTDHSNEWSEWI